MNASILTATTAALALSISSAASAAIDVHVTGTTFGQSWGVWATGLFQETFHGHGSYHHAFSDGGSGNPMDVMMPFSDGTSIDGTDVTMRMITFDTVGNVGDTQLELTDWSIWIGTDDISIHVSWESSAGPLALDNLGSSGKDGVRYFAGGFDEQLTWTLERADGSVETFDTSFESFDVTFPVPAPGAAALFGLAGLTASRRRRG